MRTLKNIGFGLMHGLIMVVTLFAVVGFSFLVVAKHVALTLMAYQFSPWVAIIAATAVCIGIIFVLAAKVFMPYLDWLEPELRRREREIFPPRKRSVGRPLPPNAW